MNTRTLSSAASKTRGSEPEDATRILAFSLLDRTVTVTDQPSVQRQEVEMKGTRLLGAVLLALGILALAYGGFSYTKSTDRASIGPFKLEVQDRERVNVPTWAGVASAVVGGVLLARKQ